MMETQLMPNMPKIQQKSPAAASVQVSGGSPTATSLKNQLNAIETNLLD